MKDESQKFLLVSVFMMTYNHAPYIEQALKGILLQQVVFNLEIVVGEDCSTDGTRSIIKQYAEKHPEKFKLILQQQNVGAHRNQIDILSACQGKYIALCEGDDYWTDPLKLQKQVDFLEASPDFAICFHKVQLLKEGKLIEDDLTNVPAQVSTIEDLANENYIHTPSCVFRNYGQNSFGEHFIAAPLGDYYLHIMNARFGKIYHLEETMAVYRIHSNATWNTTSVIHRYEKTCQSIAYILADLDQSFAEARFRLTNRYVALLQALLNHQELTAERKKQILRHATLLPTLELVLLVLDKADHIERLKLEAKFLKKERNSFLKMSKYALRALLKRRQTKNNEQSGES
jgi:glycosyltransferase involved in cell wall biosynthesis